ncbi:MAG: hypothetical protein ACYSUK_01145 [Planctomycetota bacterium]|jgi:hypothetical protein
MNIKGILNFFEEHVEKIVLVLVSIVCIWLFFTWVIISPNHVEYKGRKFIPGSIDSYIHENSVLSLKSKLNRPAEPASAYEAEYNKFIAHLNSPLGNINLNIYPQMPGNISEDEWKKDSKYGVPQIGQVTEAVAEHIRAVAYVPTETITPEIPYDKAQREPNDVDLVTVEAKFNVAKLYENFYENFAGSEIHSEWQDPCSARPIFAAVDLQRQELLSNGSWSDWNAIPRIKIESNKDLFKIIDDVKDLPSGGMKLRLLQYSSPQIARYLLQPNSYSIASPKEDWYPPYLHEKYNKIREEVEREESRKAAEQAKKERSEKTKRNTKTTGGGARGTGTSTRGGPGMGGGLSGIFGNQTGTRGANTRESNTRGSARDTRGSRSQNPTRTGADTTSATDTLQSKKTTVKDIENEFSKSLITNYAKLYNMTEPLVFWAIDDTAKPNHTYRYKIRLGIFNPMAGTEHFTDEYTSYRDKVVLWSEFCNETEAVEIPGRLYFFPLSAQEETKSVEIKVSKYVLGYWHSNRFQGIKPGEIIGSVANTRPLTGEEQQKNIEFPKEVNYNTGSILVDVVPVQEWTGTSNLSQQNYSELLYSPDGEKILRMPVKSRYWAKNVLNKYNEINRLEKEPIEPLRSFGDKSKLKLQQLPRKGTGRKSMMETLMQEAFQNQ